MSSISAMQEPKLQNYVNGSWQSSAASEFVEVINPATAELLTRTPLSTQAEVDAAAKTYLDQAWKVLDEALQKDAVGAGRVRRDESVVNIMLHQRVDHNRRYPGWGMKQCRVGTAANVNPCAPTEFFEFGYL